MTGLLDFKKRITPMSLQSLDASVPSCLVPTVDLNQLLAALIDAFAAAQRTGTSAFDLCSDFEIQGFPALSEADQDCPRNTPRVGWCFGQDKKSGVLRRGRRAMGIRRADAGAPQNDEIS
ncbi:MAG: hypothetical protein NDJ19_05730 [Ramlibacter sp.]|nr:hypothetical protein [Ramlibacter sp.]